MELHKRRNVFFRLPLQSYLQNSNRKIQRCAPAFNCPLFLLAYASKEQKQCACRALLSATF